MRIEQHDIIGTYEEYMGYSYVRVNISFERFNEICVGLGLAKPDVGVKPDKVGYVDVYLFKDGADAAVYWPNNSYFYSR